MKKFQCPYCNCDLTKEGIKVVESGWNSYFLSYNSKGELQNDQLLDSETDEYTAYCGNCDKALELELGDIWDTLPEMIGKGE